MRKPAGNRRLVRRRLGDGGDRFIAGDRRAAPEIEFAVFHIGNPGVVVGAGVRARRVACDQIVDFELVLNGAQTVFEGAGWFWHERFSWGQEGERVLAPLWMRARVRRSANGRR